MRKTISMHWDTSVDWIDLAWHRQPNKGRKLRQHSSHHPHDQGKPAWIHIRLTSSWMHHG